MEKFCWLFCRKKQHNFERDKWVTAVSARRVQRSLNLADLTLTASLVIRLEFQCSSIMKCCVACKSTTDNASRCLTFNFNFSIHMKSNDWWHFDCMLIFGIASVRFGLERERNSLQSKLSYAFFYVEFSEISNFCRVPFPDIGNYTKRVIAFFNQPSSSLNAAFFSFISTANHIQFFPLTSKSFVTCPIRESIRFQSESEELAYEWCNA